MFFTEMFNITPTILDRYGAVNINLSYDTPLFIDPMLIFYSDDPKYKQLHDYIIKYLSYLNTISKNEMSLSERRYWFNFNEIPNNWLGLSKKGNHGKAMGAEYADYLYKNLNFILNNNNISSSIHIEKITLLKEGTGRDKISDIMVNLLLGYFCEYTEKFAKKYINSKLLDKFTIDKAFFDFSKQDFIPKTYILPFALYKNRKEFILLTPKNILRQGEPFINYKDFTDRYVEICNCISNDALRFKINKYLSDAVKKYEQAFNKVDGDLTDKKINNIKKEAFIEFVKINPEVYDYYILLKESNADKAILDSRQERNLVLYAGKELIDTIKDLFKDYKSSNCSARDETISRIKFFKHKIEECGAYRLFYKDGVPLDKEFYFQRAFELVWPDSEFQLDAEANNGGGAVDFLVSKGNKNKVIVEFKMAKNNKLAHVFKQVERYEQGNKCDNGFIKGNFNLVVIIAFNKAEVDRVYRILNNVGQMHEIDKSIFIIDCTYEKKTASKL